MILAHQNIALRIERLFDNYCFEIATLELPCPNKSWFEFHVALGALYVRCAVHLAKSKLTGGDLHFAFEKLRRIGLFQKSSEFSLDGLTEIEMKLIYQGLTEGARQHGPIFYGSPAVTELAKIEQMFLRDQNDWKRPESDKDVINLMAQCLFHSAWKQCFTSTPASEYVPKLLEEAGYASPKASTIFRKRNNKQYPRELCLELSSNVRIEKNIKAG